MKMHILPALAAGALGLAALAAPTTSYAANVGYHGRCSGASSPVDSIVAAGHTPVPVTTLDAGSLTNLDALLILSCGFSANADVNAAVANGMSVIIHDWNPGSTTGAKLPGAPSLSIISSGGGLMDLASGSPIVSGPGGLLTNASLDGGTSSNHGYATLASLPAGSTPLTIVEGNPTQVVSLAYQSGAGRVVYGAMPLDHYLPGGIFDQYGLCTTNTVCAGMQTYLTNVIAWAVGPTFTSCAAEGYTGTKLTMCRQICEIDQTPTRLSGLIRIWMGAYRSEPPCAR